MTKRQKQVGGRKEALLEIAGSTELQSLLQANRDLAVSRDRLGDVGIVHVLRNGDLRRVEVLVVDEKEGNPTIRVIGQQIPASYQAKVHAAYARVRQEDRTSEDISRADELSDRRRDALQTYVNLRIIEDEQVYAKVTYQKEEAPEGLTMKADPYELVTTAKRGLGLLQAYDNDPNPMKAFEVERQIFDDYKPGLESDIAEASPLLDKWMRSEGNSFIDLGTKACYALTVLNKVTEAMLPGEMPPAPQNRREPRRRTTSPALRRRPAGR